MKQDNKNNEVSNEESNINFMRSPIQVSRSTWSTAHINRNAVRMRQLQSKEGNKSESIDDEEICLSIEIDKFINAPKHVNYNNINFVKTCSLKK